MAWSVGGTEPEPPAHAFRALWDTGATISVISQTVVDDCDLKPIAPVEVHGVHGPSMTFAFLVNLRLPNKVMIPGLLVTLGVLKDADVLIGMDIITKGDFAVTNSGGRTKFTFRMPSLGGIDFTEEG